MRVKNVMTKDPSWCLPSDPTPKAARIMRDEDAGVVPVLESEQSGRVVGVVTDRDLCMNVIAEDRAPGSVTVEACMTATVVTCFPTVPVVDEQGRLQGIVSMADLVARGDVKATEAHDTLEKVSAPSSEPSKPRARSTRVA